MMRLDFRLSRYVCWPSFLLVLLGFTAAVAAAPKAEPWPLWDRSGARTQPIDHQPWSDVLARLVTGDAEGRYVAYAQFDAQAREQLDQYLAALQQIDPRTFSRNEQLAYWINLYNARTVALILEHYPVDSIRDISFALFSFGPWDEPLVNVAGVDLSLNDIEHRIIRPFWKEPRVHYLLNCASLGCPDLWPEAITAERLEVQLEQAAKRFINQRKGVDMQRRHYSSIYHWFAEDFGGAPGVKQHLLEYAQPTLSLWLKANFSTLDDDYDWRLNRAR